MPKVKNVQKPLILPSFKITLYQYNAGTLRIYGDPTDRGGNIVLRLKESDSPVRIVPGTKNLTLTRRLDKEVSVQGAAILSKKTL